MPPWLLVVSGGTIFQITCFAWWDKKWVLVSFGGTKYQYLFPMVGQKVLLAVVGGMKKITWKVDTCLAWWDKNNYLLPLVGQFWFLLAAFGGTKKILATLGGTIISRTNKNFNSNSNFISHLEELSKVSHHIPFFTFYSDNVRISEVFDPPPNVRTSKQNKKNLPSKLTVEDT